jgi:hypothetical protein
VFIDGDGSDCPEFLEALVTPILRNEYDLVIGSRIRGQRESGSLNFAQIVAGRLAGWMLQAWYGVKFTDMSPFRAIRSELLESLPMREETYGLESRDADAGGTEAMRHPGNSGESSPSSRRRSESFRNT